MILRYQHPDTDLTLREGLAEVRAADAAIAAEAPGPLDETLEAHDAVHVVFGLGIGEGDEVLAHAWMLFGTDLTMAEMRAVMADRQHRRLAHDVGHLRRLGMVVRALPRLLDAWRRSRRMIARWPWRDYRPALDQPLAEIRARYGIVLPPPGPPRADAAADPRGPHHAPVPCSS